MGETGPNQSEQNDVVQPLALQISSVMGEVTSVGLQSQIVFPFCVISGIKDSSLTSDMDPSVIYVCVCC